VADQDLSLKIKLLAQDEVSATIKKAITELEKLGDIKGADKLRQQLKQIEQGLGGIKEQAKVSDAALVQLTAQASQAFTGLASSALQTNLQFEKLRTTLKTTLGSEGAADRAFATIQSFAASTPFQVSQVTEAYISLKNRGLEPTNKLLTELGDLAGSQGKDLQQVIEAFLDATTGEFERLKEFGIQASSSGDQVTLAFKGVSQTVAKTPEAIAKVISSFGELKGVAGGMEAQAQTLGGQLSNLQDNADRVAVTLGGPFLDVLNKALTSFNSLPQPVQNVGGGLIFLGGAVVTATTAWAGLSALGVPALLGSIAIGAGAAAAVLAPYAVVAASAGAATYGLYQAMKNLRINEFADDVNNGASRLGNLAQQLGRVAQQQREGKPLNQALVSSIREQIAAEQDRLNEQIRANAITEPAAQAQLVALAKLEQMLGGITAADKKRGQTATEVAEEVRQAAITQVEALQSIAEKAEIAQQLDLVRLQQDLNQKLVEQEGFEIRRAEINLAGKEKQLAIAQELRYQQVKITGEGSKEVLALDKAIAQSRLEIAQSLTERMLAEEAKRKPLEDFGKSVLDLSNVTEETPFGSPTNPLTGEGGPKTYDQVAADVEAQYKHTMELAEAQSIVRQEVFSTNHQYVEAVNLIEQAANQQEKLNSSIKTTQVNLQGAVESAQILGSALEAASGGTSQKLLFNGNEFLENFYLNPRTNVGFQNPNQPMGSGSSGMEAFFRANANLIGLGAYMPMPFASGGIVSPRVGGTVARIGEAGSAELVLPLNRQGGAFLAASLGAMQIPGGQNQASNQELLAAIRGLGKSLANQPRGDITINGADDVTGTVMRVMEHRAREQYRSMKN